ncbi:curli production assembly/transport protein CsgE [Vibrio aphrogenes]|uniref:curli production assembly/transport protein CsgE n=1 Tax=Vibrio aphrogenes TaxID=1891186 RepID=UPI000B34C4E1|nr:curli production assembly/transport protein CsgE [Vibrio aphrogenes]
MKINPVLFLLFFVFISTIELVRGESGNDAKNIIEEKGSLNESAILPSNEGGIDGIIIDQTMTVLGRNFYFYFSQNLNEQHEDLSINLSVKERPTALSGSIITVFHFNTPIYRTSLSPGLQQAELKAKQAVDNISYYLLKWKLERKYSDKTDLAPDEL